MIDSLFGGQYGQSSFSRSGDKYAYCTYTTGGVFVLNFDRCTGDFSPYHFYSIPTRDSTLSYDFASGTCFSPDGKLLYANTSNAIYQIEVADTSASSVQFIHGNDLVDSQRIPTPYMTIDLGADDRLYIANQNYWRNTISYIEEPNKRGQACNFCAQCLTTPFKNAVGLPNMPYYHLGKKEGSECDTLKPIVKAPTWQAIRIYPNPVSGMLNVYLPLEENTTVSVRLYNAIGQKVFSSNRTTNALQQFTIDMNALSKGIYILRIESEVQVWKEKVVRD